jgi:cytochrome b pre-mRNA-processing protein 3
VRRLLNLRVMFKPRPARAAGEALYGAAVRQARQPGFYGAIGAPDTAEGRFELYSLHVVLLLHRLKGEGAAAADAAQALFDAYVGALDNALREMGVGDLTVPKNMRRLGGAFYGRATQYDPILANRDRDALVLLLGRTVFEGTENGACGKLADYVMAAAASLADEPLEAVLKARITWPAVPA